MSRLEQVAVGILEPAADNPRRHVEADPELVATIESLGVLEPLVVSKSRANGYTVISGHRRLAAAKKAGLTEVPCVVHDDLDDRTRAEMMLVENLQREDLSPLEEAAAYQRLVDLGHKQRDLAKVVGRSQSHISKRTALLKLPEMARTAIDAGRITIEDAHGLAKLPADKAAALFKGGATPTGWSIDSAVRKHEDAKRRAAAEKQLAAAGTPVVSQNKVDHYWEKLLSRLGLDLDAHAGEPCHAGSIGYGSQITYLCLEPARHAADGESSLKIVEAPEVDDEEDEDDGAEYVPPDETAEQKAAREEREARWAAERARVAERHALTDERVAFATALLDRLDEAAAIDLTIDLYVDSSYIEEPLDNQRTLELLGLWDGITYPDETQRPARHEKIRAFAAESRRNRARILAAVALANFEADARSVYWSAEDCALDDEQLPSFRTYLAFLEAHGYERTDFDRHLLGDVDEPAAVDGQVDGHVISIEPVGKAKPPKKWRVRCSCGDLDHTQTTVAYAKEAHATHLTDVGWEQG